MKRLFFWVLAVSFAIGLNAQEISISGVVKDADTYEVLPGANVYVAGTTTGTITNIDGKFSLTASVGDSLVVSYIGFNNQHVAVTGETNIEIMLMPMMSEVDEVVVVGYGYVKKSDLTGSVSSIGEDLMQQTTNTNITEAMQGRLAGVQVTSAEGSPGGSFNFKIRGASTINANSQPLYVIDGIPLEVDEVSFDDGIPGSVESPISDIDPANIESIEILKDASATAIYGSRGANGVVMITTKSGQTGNDFVTFDMSSGFQTVKSRVDLLDAPGYAKFRFGKDPSPSSPYANWQSYADSTNNNWQDELFSTGYIQNYNVRVSGGTKETKYSVGGGYFKHNGVIGNKYFKRYSGNLRLNQKLGKRATFDVKFSIGSTKNDGFSTGGDDTPKAAGLIRQIFRSPPTRELDYDVETIDDDLDTYSELDNPFNFLNNASRINESNRMLGKVELQYDILENLKFTSRAGINYNTAEFKSFFPSTTGRGRNTGGFAMIGQREKVSLVSESFLNYHLKIADHKIDAMIAGTIEKSESERLDVKNQDFDIPDLGYNAIEMGLDLVVPKTEPLANQMLSYLGRVQYNFRERYLVTGSFRADGTSRFLNHKWGYFPSASAAWRISEEWFFDNIKPVVSNAKLRISYGVTGNQRLPDYMSYSQMTVSNYTFNGTLVSGLAITKFGNPDLKWERTHSYNAGLELGFLKNKISTTVDLYLKKTNDMLMQLDLPVTSGYKNYWANMGSMKNQGIELSINTTNIDRKHFSWTTNFNVAVNRNKILSLGGESDYRPVGANNNMIHNWARLMVGEPIGVWYGYETNGIYKTQEELDALPTSYGADIGEWKMVDQNGDGYIDENDRTILGKAEPAHFGGLVNSFKYKQFTFDLFLSWSYGGVIYNANKWDMLDMANNNFNRLAQVNDAWVPEDIMAVDEDGNEFVAIQANPESNRPGYKASNNELLVDDYIEDGSYLRVKTLTLSYTFKKKTIKKVGLRDVKVYVRGENLFTLTNYTGFDPEVDMDMGTRGLAPGIDYGAYPRAQTISFGVSVKI